MTRLHSMGADDAADFVVCKKPSTCLLCDRLISKCGKYFHFSLTQPMLPKILSVVPHVLLCRIVSHFLRLSQFVRQSGNRATEWKSCDTVYFIFNLEDVQINLTDRLFVIRAEKTSEISTCFPTTRAWQQETTARFLAMPGEPLRICQPGLVIRQLRTRGVQESTIYGVCDRQALQQIKLWWYWSRIGDFQWFFCFRLAPEQSAAASSWYRLNKWICLASTQAQHSEWS